MKYTQNNTNSFLSLAFSMFISYCHIIIIGRFNIDKQCGDGSSKKLIQQLLQHALVLIEEDC